MFELVPKEVLLTPITKDLNYEYGEMRFTAVFKSILQENSKLLPEMSDDDPRKKKTTQVIAYYDSLIKDGWEEYEVAFPKDFVGEVKRLRKRKQG